MKSTFASKGTLALIIWLNLVAGAANAATFWIDNWSGSASTGYSADFGHSNIPIVFHDYYSFSLPAASSGNVEVNSFTSPINSDVVIEALTIYDPSIELSINHDITKA